MIGVKNKIKFTRVNDLLSYEESVGRGQPYLKVPWESAEKMDGTECNNIVVL